jgi:hypothetical protein
MKFSTIFSLLMLIIIVVGTGSILFRSNKDPGGNTMACIMAEEMVKKRLRAPSTASFQSCSEIKAYDAGGGWWSVSGYVDAQNGFGAKLRSTWAATVHELPNGSWEARGINIVGG